MSAVGIVSNVTVLMLIVGSGHYCRVRTSQTSCANVELGFLRPTCWTAARQCSITCCSGVVQAMDQGGHAVLSACRLGVLPSYRSTLEARSWDRHCAGSHRSAVSIHDTRESEVYAGHLAKHKKHPRRYGELLWCARNRPRTWREGTARSGCNTGSFEACIEAIDQRFGDCTRRGD